MRRVRHPHYVPLAACVRVTLACQQRLYLADNMRTNRNADVAAGEGALQVWIVRGVVTTENRQSACRPAIPPAPAHRGPGLEIA